jgi:uroporphyrin-3 C-methyltransferase
MTPDKDKPISDSPAEGDDGQEPSPDSVQDAKPVVTNNAVAGGDSADSRTTAAPPKPDTGSGRGLGTIALILAVVACIATVYMWYRFDVQGRHRQEISAANLSGDLKAVTESARALEKRQDVLSAAQQKLDTSQDDLGRLIQEKLESSVNTLREQQEALAASVSKIYESMDRSIDSWALEEVEQLLRMANQSVSLAGDIKGGIIGLELADKRLTELGNPELLEVRRLIAEELGQLKAVGQADLPGIAFRLAGIIATIDKLPLVNEPDRPLAAGSSQPAPVAEENMWMEAGQDLLDDLKGLIRIQKVSEPAKPLLPPEQRYFLVGNLRLMLSAAQIAVLHADTATFKANVEQATLLLSDYFDTEQQSVKSALADLQNLAAENLASDRPNISGSVVELQSIKSRMTSQ